MVKVRPGWNLISSSIGAGANYTASQFALTVTDATGATVNATIVSTYFNNNQLTGPAVWWEPSDPDLIDLGKPINCTSWWWFMD